MRPNGRGGYYDEDEPLKTYKVTVRTKIEVDAPNRDDAIEHAAEIVSEMKAHDFEYTIIKKRTR